MKALRLRFTNFTNRHPMLTMLATMLLLVLAWSMLPDDHIQGAEANESTANCR